LIVAPMQYLIFFALFSVAACGSITYPPGPDKWDQLPDAQYKAGDPAIFWQQD